MFFSPLIKGDVYVHAFFMRYLCQADAEASEDLLHVASLLHGDDTQVILLVHPDQEGLVVIVPGGKQFNSLSLHSLQRQSQ